MLPIPRCRLGVALQNEEFGEIIVRARRSGAGILFPGLHPGANLGRRSVVNRWDPERAFDATSLADERLVVREGHEWM